MLVCFSTKSVNPFKGDDKGGCSQTIQITSLFMTYSENVKLLERSVQAEIIGDILAAVCNISRMNPLALYRKLTQKHRSCSLHFSLTYEKLID